MKRFIIVMTVLSFAIFSCKDDVLELAPADAVSEISAFESPSTI